MSMVEPLPIETDPVLLIDRDGHEFEIRWTPFTGFHTGRVRYGIKCNTCDEFMHEATTGPYGMIRSHLARKQTEKETGFGGF